MRYFLALLYMAIATSCSSKPDANNNSTQAATQYQAKDTATFAGGCFWCVEASFEQIKGVAEAVSGYAGGEIKNPSYQQVASGATKHAETVEVYYDPEVISYSTLLDIFFTAHDPTQLNRQGPDYGPQYRSAIFYRTEEEKALAQQKIDSINNAGIYDDPVVTQLNRFEKFWIAEDYHQDYEEHNPNNPYIVNVSRPKINKVKKQFADLLKPGY